MAEQLTDWAALCRELVAAVSRATEAMSQVLSTPHISKVEGERIAEALAILSELIRDFFNIAPSPDTLDYHTEMTTDGQRIREKMTEQIDLIDAIIEKAEAI
jgi:hypothetical protein